MSDIYLDPTTYKQVSLDDVISQKQLEQSSALMALTDAQIKPYSHSLTDTAVYAQLDTMAKKHLRPMSDKEYFFLVDVLKKNGYTSDKLYQLHDLYAIAVAVLTNYFAFKRPEELDPIVERYVESIDELPSYSLDSFNKSLEYFYTRNWFGKPIYEAKENYSKNERLIFGSLSIAFVDEYNEDRAVKLRAQEIIDSTQDARNEIAVNEATGTIIQKMAPLVASAQALTNASPKSKGLFPVASEPLAYEQKVHPMLRFGFVPRKR